MAKAVKKTAKQLELLTPEVVEVVNEVAVEISPVKDAILQLSKEGAVDLIINDYKNDLPVTKKFLDDQTKKILKINITSLEQIEDIEFLNKAGTELRSYDKDVKEKRKQIDAPFKAVTSATIDVEKEFLAITKKPLDHIRVQDQVIRQLRDEQEQIEQEKLMLKTKERVDQLKAIGLETTALGWSIDFNGELFEMDLPTLQQMEDSTFLLQLENAKSIMDKFKKAEEERAEQERIAEEEKQALIKAKEESDAKAQQALDKIAELEQENNRIKQEQDKRDLDAKKLLEQQALEFRTEKRIFQFEKIGFDFKVGYGYLYEYRFFHVSEFVSLCDSDFNEYFIGIKDKAKEYKTYLDKCSLLDKLLAGTGIVLKPGEFNSMASIYDEGELKQQVDNLIEERNKQLAEQKKQMMQARASQIRLNDFVFNENTQSYIFTSEFNDWQKSISFVLTDSDDFQKEFDKALNSKRDILLERAEIVRKSTLPSEKDVKMIEEYFDDLKSVIHPDVKHLENFGNDLNNLIESYRKTMY